MSPDESPSTAVEGPDVDRLLTELEELEATVDEPHEREKVRETMTLVRRIPWGETVEERIHKYTTRDMAEAFVGGVLFSMPLLVEDGVFVIAEHFVTVHLAALPVYLIANVAFIVLLTVGLIYWADIREVQISRPLFGLVPRRLTGVLLISFLVAAGMMVLWGRAFEGAPTRLEVFARITVVWAPAAFGASLGDILPGESRGYDVVFENLDDIVLPDD